MDRADTIIKNEESVIVLPNQAIVDKMQEVGLNIDDRLAHNPGFIINLFKLFDISDIQDMRIGKDKIVLTTICRDITVKYEIVPNSENGLSMVFDIKDDYEGSNFLRSRKIVSLFPSGDGFKKIVAFEQGIGQVDQNDTINVNELSVTEYDSKGLEIKTDVITEEKKLHDYIFSYHPNIVPLTSAEYSVIMAKQIETKLFSNYVSRERDYADITRVHEKMNLHGHKVKHTRYFDSDEMYDLATLNKANSTEPTDVNALVNNLLQKYDSFDPAVGRLMINLVNLLNQDVTIRISKPTDFEKRGYKSLLDTYEKNGKTLSV